LKDRNLNHDTRADLIEQKKRIEDLVERHQQDQKQLQQDLTLKRKRLKDTKAALKKIQSEKTKMDVPTIAEMENIFSDYGITPARYQGGKLNGVDCHEVMSRVKTLFEQIETLLLSVSHDDRCSDAQVKHVCHVHRDIFVTLDTISSKIRMKHGEPKEEDFEILNRSLLNLDYLWAQAGMSYRPKIHGVLSHAAEQVQCLGGIGDLLEDELEHLHQMSKKISERTSRIKNKVQQAESHSKIEAKINNKEIRAAKSKVKLETKREFKKRRVDSFARGVQAKLERDSSRIETLAAVEEKPYSRIISFYENEKARQLEN